MYEDNQINSNYAQQQPMPFPPSVPGYPAYPPYPFAPDPWATSPAFRMGQVAIIAERDRAQAVIENSQLKDRLARKEQLEDAYCTAGSVSGKTYTVDKTGRLVELMDREVKAARHLFTQPPLPRREFYEIQLEGTEKLITLDVRDYNNDAKLLQAFQEIPGIHVRFCRTAKLTAALLRQAVCQRIQAVELPFYAGWRESTDGGFNFWTFADGSTHVQEDGIVSPLTVGTPMTAAAMATAAQRFYQDCGLDATQPEHWLLSAVFHLAALTSLLRQLGHPFPLSLCLLVGKASTQTWATSLFKWHGDMPLSLGLPPAFFKDEFLRRKDEPILILDERVGRHEAKNAALLEEILASHQIPWRNGREEEYTPLQALPIILSTTASSLTVSPDCLTMEIPTDLTTAITEPVVSEYLTAFIQYAAGHIDRLWHLLDTMEGRARFCAEDSDLAANYVTALGNLLAVDIFAREFHAFCGLDTGILNDTCPDAEHWLVELLEQAADKLLNAGDIVAQFVEIVRAQFESGSLHGCPMGRQAEANSNAVYFDDKRLAFTVSAMSTVCRGLGLSRPLVLRALAEAGMLLGKPVNEGTFLTRISIYNVYGIRKSERVYLFDRGSFDELGDPLCFEGEEKP